VSHVKANLNVNLILLNLLNVFLSLEGFVS